MTKEQIAGKIKEIIDKPIMSTLCTIKDGKPWGRIMMIQRIDDSMNFYSSTATGSRKAIQIKDEPNVHLTLTADPANPMAAYMQIVAKAEILCDKEHKEKLWNENLKAFFSGPEDLNYCVLKYVPEKIELWGMTKSFTPLVWTAE